MMYTEITDQTPIALLTVGQLRQLFLETQPIVNNQLFEQKTEPKMLYSIKELADFLQCSTVTAQKVKSSGRIPFMQTGRKCVFNGDAVLEAMAVKVKGGRK